jgi:hypothetical protein
MRLRGTQTLMVLIVKRGTITLVDTSDFFGKCENSGKDGVVYPVSSIQRSQSSEQREQRTANSEWRMANGEWRTTDHGTRGLSGGVTEN